MSDNCLKHSVLCLSINGCFYLCCFVRFSGRNNFYPCNQVCNTDLVAYLRGKGIVAMGNIVECERKVSKSDDVFNVVAYDNLFNLQKSSDNVYFASGKKTKSILTAIFKSWGITIS